MTRRESILEQVAHARTWLDGVANGLGWSPDIARSQLRGAILHAERALRLAEGKEAGPLTVRVDRPADPHDELEQSIMLALRHGGATVNMLHECTGRQHDPDLLRRKLRSLATVGAVRVIEGAFDVYEATPGAGRVELHAATEPEAVAMLRALRAVGIEAVAARADGSTIEMTESEG